MILIMIILIIVMIKSSSPLEDRIECGDLHLVLVHPDVLGFQQCLALPQDLDPPVLHHLLLDQVHPTTHMHKR